MSYEHKDWVDGEELTPDALDNIEVGVMSVNSGYAPYDWENGDVVTAERLNHIEDGIANAGIEFPCKLTIDNQSSTTLTVGYPAIVNGRLQTVVGNLNAGASWTYDVGTSVDIKLQANSGNISVYGNPSYTHIYSYKLYNLTYFGVSASRDTTVVVEDVAT